MSSWSDKLQRVDGGGLNRTNSAKVGQPRVACEGCEDIACENGEGTAAPRNVAVVRATPSLDALRDRIAHMVAQSGAPRVASPELSHPPHEAIENRVDLGFAASDHPLGPLHARQRWFRAHRVGRVPVAIGATASMQMIALLSLDPSLASLDPMKALYFDVETSGLATGAGTLAFLVGLGYFQPPSEPDSKGIGAFVVEQLLLRQPGEEGALLARIAELMDQASLIVSYNGKAFDLPLFKTRCVMNRLPIPAGKPHVDLLHIARRVHRHRLVQRALARVEADVLGFERIDDVPSDEIPARYFHFLRTGDEQPLAAVVEHNVADVLSMSALMGVYGEPLEGLSPLDWVGVARTLKRAKSLDLAQDMAERAVDGGAGVEGIRVRAEIARTRGDKARALADFESLVHSVDDPGIRLALAKLYEHHAKEPLRALSMLARGTSEGPSAHEHRRQRLLRKARAGKKGGGDGHG